MDHKETSLQSPLPWIQIMSAMLLNFMNGLGITLFFPVLPLMVQWLLQLPNQEEHNLGFFVGAFTTSYGVGQLLTSACWGGLSDRLGRKPVILLSLFCWSTLMVFFSISSSFWVSVGIRFVQGLTGGFSPVVRAHVMDITDDSNRARAMALVGVMYGVSDVFGPPIGGLLVRPRSQYPTMFETLPSHLQLLFTWFPYMLPCCFIALVGFILTAVCCFTLQKISGVQDNNINDALGEPASGFELVKRYKGYRRVAFMAFIWGIVISAYDALVPLWAIDELGVTPAELGSIQAVCGIASVVSCVYLVEMTQKKLGSIIALVASYVVIALCCACPLFDMALKLQDNTSASIGFLIATYFLKSLAVESCFANLYMLVSDTTPDREEGAAQGFADAAMSLGWALGPWAGPSLYAWSSSPQMLSGALPFMALVLLTLLCAMLTHSLQNLPSNVGSVEPLLGDGRDAIK